jgi:hypothetical protein
MSPKHSPTNGSHRSRQVRRAGSIILAGGLVVALVIGLTARQPEFEDSVDSHEASAIARIGGTATVRAVQFDQWLASLWHGERLAWTIAVLSLVMGGGCFYVAGLMDEDVGEDGEDEA